MRTFLGVGVMGEGLYVSKDHHGKPTKHYQLWGNMMTRCYSSSPTYKNYFDCEVHETWLNFQNFAKWCDEQKGFGNLNWHLDKDILIKGNKVYGPDTCVFVPSEVNKYYLKREASRGDLPIGVTRTDNERYMSQGNFKGFHSKFIGRYSTPEEAFLAYKNIKESHGRYLASMYSGIVDERVIEALNNYEVNIND